MKRNIFILIVLSVVLYSCSTQSKITKAVAYKELYTEKPLTILLMPPINKSTNVEAKEIFHSTLNVPLANAGYYVIPPFLSMDILKRESAYDAEMFINGHLAKFGEIFGADMVMFTTIHKWNKTYGNVAVEVEYTLKSTKTDQIVYTRKGRMNFNTNSNAVSGGGLVGALVKVAATTINTAATKYVEVARACNAYTFTDLPVGNYGTPNPNEGAEFAGLKEFSVTLSK